MCVFTYIYIYIYVCVCVRAHTNARKYVRTDLSKYILTYVWMYVFMYVYMHAYVYVYLRVFVCMYVYMCTSACVIYNIYIYICVCMCVCVYVLTYVCMYVCMYVCLFVFIYSLFLISCCFLYHTISTTATHSGSLYRLYRTSGDSWKSTDYKLCLIVVFPCILHNHTVNCPTKCTNFITVKSTKLQYCTFSSFYPLHVSTRVGHPQGGGTECLAKIIKN
jgi:hypothetical protein